MARGEQGIDKFMEQLGDPSFVSKLDDAFKQLSEEGKEGAWMT